MLCEKQRGELLHLDMFVCVCVCVCVPQGYFSECMRETNRERTPSLAYIVALKCSQSI